MLRDTALGGGGADAIVDPAAAVGLCAPESGALQRCVAVATDVFADRYWGRAPLLTPAAAGSNFADLFSAAAVDELISRRGLRTPFLRMAKEGAVLPERSFTRTGGSGATISDQAADDKILDQLSGGATLVLQALHRSWPPLVEFGSALAAQLGHPVQINSYITPAQNQGFAAHYDTHDVFVLQIAGTKRWVVSEPVLEHPLPDQTWDRRKPAVAARAAEPPLLDTVLAPGDALYLPRGFLHSASAQGELSIHLTVGVHPVTGYRLAELLLQALKDDPEIRRSLPMAVDLADPAVLADQLRLVADRLASAARHPDQVLGRAATAVGADLRAATRPAPLSPLAQLAFSSELGVDDRLRLRPGLRFVVSGNGCAISALDKTVTLPQSLAAAARVLLDGEVHTPGELDELEPADQLVLARRLLREGFLVPAPVGQPG